MAATAAAAAAAAASPWQPASSYHMPRDAVGCLADGGGWLGLLGSRVAAAFSWYSHQVPSASETRSNLIVVMAAACVGCYGNLKEGLYLHGRHFTPPTPYHVTQTDTGWSTTLTRMSGVSHDKTPTTKLPQVLGRNIT